MKTISLGLVLVFGVLVLQTSGQSRHITVLGLEIDGKVLQHDYKVYFWAGEKWRRAARTSTGFVLPKEIYDKDYLDILFSFGGNQLKFSGIHNSKLRTNWIVGVDEPPFSHELNEMEDRKNVKRIYYIRFLDGKGLDTRMEIKEHR